MKKYLFLIIGFFLTGSQLYGMTKEQAENFYNLDWAVEQFKTAGVVCQLGNVTKTVYFEVEGGGLAPQTRTERKIISCTTPRATVIKTYRTLQQEFHPDKFEQLPEGARDIPSKALVKAMQEFNDFFDQLKKADPLAGQKKAIDEAFAILTSKIGEYHEKKELGPERSAYVREIVKVLRDVLPFFNKDVYPDEKYPGLQDYLSPANTLLNRFLEFVSGKALDAFKRGASIEAITASLAILKDNELNTHVDFNELNILETLGSLLNPLDLLNAITELANYLENFNNKNLRYLVLKGVIQKLQTLREKMIFDAITNNDVNDLKPYLLRLAYIGEEKDVAIDLTRAQDVIAYCYIPAMEGIYNDFYGIDMEDKSIDSQVEMNRNSCWDEVTNRFVIIMQKLLKTTDEESKKAAAARLVVGGGTDFKKIAQERKLFAKLQALLPAAPVSPPGEKGAQPKPKKPVSPPETKTLDPLAISSATESSELLDRLTTLVKILNSHIEKMLSEYVSGKFGKHRAEVFIYSTIRTMAALKSKFPDGFSEKSDEGLAYQAAFDVMKKLTEKMLGVDGVAFCNMLTKFIDNGEKFDAKESEASLKKVIAYTQRFRDEKLFAYTQQVNDFKAYVKKDMQGYIDDRMLIKTIFYCTRSNALKIFTSAYQALIKLEIKKIALTSAEFNDFLKAMIKDFNAWNASKERDIAVQDALRRYLVKSKGGNPEDEKALAAAAPELNKMFKGIQSKLDNPDEISVEGSIPVDPDAELVKLFGEHVKNFGKRPYPKYSSKALGKDMAWQELITELIKKAVAWGSEKLPADLLATFKENLGTYVAMLSTGAEKFERLTSNEEKNLDNNFNRLQALRLYVSGEDTKELTKYLPYCNDVKELVGLTYSDPESYYDKNPLVYLKIFELLYPRSGFGIGSYRIPPSPLHVLDGVIIHRYLGVSKESALEYLSLDFESLLSLAKYMTLTDMITKLKTVIKMIDAWKFPDDYKYTEYGIKDKQGLKNKYISSIIGEYVRNSVPSDKTSADFDAQTALMEAIIKYVRDTGVTNLTMDGLQQNIKDKKPLRFKVYAIKEALSLVVTSQSSLQDKKKAQLQALEDGKIIVDEQTMTIKACLDMIGDLYDQAGQKGETWWPLWDELTYYLFKVFEQLVYVPEHFLKDCTFNGAYLDKTSGERLYLLGAYVPSGYDPKIPICVRLRDADWNKNKPSRTLDLYSTLSYSQIPNVRKYLLGEDITDKVLIIDADFLNTLFAQLKKNYEENLNKVNSFADRLEGFFQQELFEVLQKHLENYFRSQVKSKYGYMLGSGYKSFEGSEEDKKWQAAQALLTTWKSNFTKKAEIIFKIKQDFYSILSRVAVASFAGASLLSAFSFSDTTPAGYNDPTLKTLWGELLDAIDTFKDYFATIGAQIGKDTKTPSGATNIDQLIGALNGLKNRLGELSQTLGNVTSEE